MDLTKQFFKYVSQNIFGLLGTSCYILADTYFIAQAAGTDGVTLLNLCLPIYNFIFAIDLQRQICYNFQTYATTGKGKSVWI